MFNVFSKPAATPHYIYCIH